MKWSVLKIKVQTTDGSLMNKLVFSGATDVDCGAIAASCFFFSMYATLLKNTDRIKNLKGWDNYFLSLSAHNLTDKHKNKMV